MSNYTLNNKLSSEVSSRPTFDLGDLPFFDDLPDFGVMPMPMTIEDRIGLEMALMLFNKTPSVSNLAEMKSFTLMLKSGLIHTSHGPVIFLFFYIPNSAYPNDPYFAFVNHANPFDTEQMATLWHLAKQSYWHVIVVDGDRQVRSVMEYENVFRLDETLANKGAADNETYPGDFALATQEFSKRYALQDLLDMPSSPDADARPMRYTLEIVPGKSIGPFRLGMTSQEIQDALRSLSVDSLTLDDLDVIVRFQDEEVSDDQKRCNQLEIRVFNNDNVVLLLGQPVNDISNIDADRLLSSISPDVRHSYAALSLYQEGIRATRWERSDDWIHCFVVMPPTAACKDESPPVFG